MAKCASVVRLSDRGLSSFRISTLPEFNGSETMRSTFVTGVKLSSTLIVQRGNRTKTIDRSLENGVSSCVIGSRHVTCDVVTIHDQHPEANSRLDPSTSTPSRSEFLLESITLFR